MKNRKPDPPYEGGSQPVVEHRPEVAGGGRSAAMMAVVVIAVLVVVFAIAWLVSPWLR